MTKIIPIVFFALLNCILFSSAIYAGESGYNGELTFMYNQDRESCGRIDADQKTIDKFTIKNLPKFEDFPAEKATSRTLSYAQLKALEEKGAPLKLRSKKVYRAIFNGRYLVVIGQVEQCTGCAYSKIIDIDSGEEINTLFMHQGILGADFRKDSSLIIENFPPSDLDACIFPFVTITFYQMKEGALVKIKELKIAETEEFQKIKKVEEPE